MHHLIGFLSFVCLTAFAQQSGSVSPVLLDPKLPSVYIRFERTGERPPVHSGESQDGVWLSIHNNTRGAISLSTESLYVGSKVVPLKLQSGKDVLGLRNAVEVSVRYFVEQENGPKVTAAADNTVAVDENVGYQRRLLGPGGDVFSTSWIPSGNTILVSLPKEHLARGYRISIPFNYEWEPDPRNIAHAAYFYANELRSK